MKDKENVILKALGTIAGIGNRIITILAMLLVIIMFMYGGYSIWSIYKTYDEAHISKEIQEMKPDITYDEPEVKEEKWDKLSGLNSDVVGWLTINDTNIDYPVVQGKDNMEYINKAFNGEFSASGAVFVDYSNAGDFSDCYSLVYGHHMSNGAMFGDLDKFQNQDYMDKHHSGTLLTRENVYNLEVFACIICDAYEEMIYGIESDNSEQYAQKLNYIESNKITWRSVDVAAEDKIIAFSTCVYSRTNGRLIVLAKMENMLLTEGCGGS